MKKGRITLGVILILFTIAQASAQQPPTVRKFTLNNGLTLVVKQDRRAPVVVSQVWYNVGSSFEHGGITGISHMLEHMMFKGTQSLGPGEFSRIVAEHGGRENAFTGQDYTAYFQQLEKSRLEISFELEADRMRNLVLSADAVEIEKQVVMEERRLRTEDNPQSLTYEHFKATAFKSSPYQYPVIGWMTDIETYRIEDLRNWYRKWYAPNNATVVVVGDVEPEAVLALAKKHFGPLPPADLARIKPQPEINQLGPKRIVVKLPAQLPYLLMGFKVPSLKTTAVDWEPYALYVLAAVLDGNDSGRLSKNLVRGREIAASAGAQYDPYARLTTLFVFSGIPARDESNETLEQALWDEVSQLKKEPISPQELKRVKTQVVAENVFARDSMFYQAMQIGQLETLGIGWEKMDEFVDRVQAITAEQVQTVARKYLIEDRMTVAVLTPQPLGNR